MKARFRVSEVEAFRQWRDDEEAELDDLLARLRGQTPPSAVMQAGTAFHEALELSCTGVTANSIGAQGYTFHMLGDFEIALASMREVRASKVYTGPGWEIAVSGQLDAIHGKRVEDHKTTGRFDPDRYLSGYQWRFYLDIFEANTFRWNVFELGETEDPMVWEVKAQHTLEQFRYPALSQDCERLVADLAAFTLIHLPERHQVRESAEAVA